MSPPDRTPYSYGERKIEDMAPRAFSPGAGRISGVLSLGLMSLLAVLCFRFPSWLTTGELRDGSIHMPAAHWPILRYPFVSGP